ncbi:MAG: aldo/keto reductase [Clostridiales bacterium]|jgi:diketogulonate reductase-like aldo/keto reductase|nr:aldo/keto reductase [Clostridiales bacterium]
MRYVKLKNGVEMPMLGFGTFLIANHEQCVEAVSHALNIGYRHIDTAARYGNESAVGEAIKKSKIKRKDLFVTTKVWIYDAGYERAKIAFDLSLQKLGLDYVDLYLVHQPFGDYYGSWRAMEELYQSGKCRAIGVSNFLPDRLVDISLNNKVVPLVNQMEFHPYFQQQQGIATMNELGVVLQGWAPFAQGKNDIFKDKILNDIAKKYSKTVSQIILNWHIQRGICAIPKSVSEDRIKQNFDIFDFELAKSDIESINAMDTKVPFSNALDPVRAKNMIQLKR